MANLIPSLSWPLSTPPPTSTPATDEYYQFCEDNVFKADLVTNFSHWFIIPSVIFLLVLGFLDERLNIAKHILGGRPGLPRPFSFLDEPRNKWGIILAFGSATTHIILVTTKAFNAEFPIWAKIFLVYILSLETSLICYPLFACMTSRHTLVGAITGLLYSAGWFAFQMYRLVLQGSCFANYTYLDVYKPPGPIIIIELPTAIFSLLVVIKFGWKLFKCLRKKKFTKSLYEEGNRKMCRYCDVIYVKHLLKKNHTNAEILNKTMPLYRKLFNHMTKPVPGFKFPIAMLITASVSCVFVYYITAYLALYMDTWFKPFTEYYDLITAANAIATILTFLCGMRNIYLVLINYRRDMRRLYRGDRTFIPSSLKKASPKTYMAQGMRFVGNSIVGSLWGSVFAYMVLFVPLALMMCVLRELSKAGMIHHLLSRLQWLIYPVCTIIIFKVQIVLVGKFFMQPKLDPGDKHRPLAIDNRIVYDVFTFFLVFLNASIGIIQFVKRVLLSVILGAFLIPRMDRSLLMRGYETMDKCYTNYVGMILVDVAHNHPVMRVFCHVAKDAMMRTRARATPTTENPIYGDVRYVESNHEQLSPARKRWYLIYTLLRNPQLRASRVRGKPTPPSSAAVVDVNEIEVSTKSLADDMSADTLGCRLRCWNERTFTIPPNITTNIMAALVVFAILIIYVGLPLLLTDFSKLLVI